MRLQSYKSLWCLVLLLTSNLGITSAFTTRKFTEWFPQFREALSPSWIDGPCKPIYNAFVGKHEGECGMVLNCLLENTTELRKTTIASAQVVLGVTPTLLASLGSTVVETSLVTSQDFVLSLLLAIGAPTVYQARITDFISVADTLQTSPTLPRGAMHLSRMSRATRVSVMIGQYTLAAAAAANTIELVLQVGSRSVVAWACGSWYLPLVWVLFSVTTFAAAALSLLVFGPKESRQGSVKSAGDTNMVACGVCRSQWGLKPGHNCNIATQTEPGYICMLLQALAKFLAFVHVLLGTFIFSSLIFIGFHDTLVIFARLTAAAIVCRAITLYQLVLLITVHGNEIGTATKSEE